MSEPIRILIADDHFVVRQGLAALLVARNGMEVVGEAATGREAVDLARKLAAGRHPDGHDHAGDGGTGSHRADQAGKPQGPYPGVDQFWREQASGRRASSRRAGVSAQGLVPG